MPRHPSKTLRISIWFVAASFMVSFVTPFATTGQSHLLNGSWMSLAGQGEGAGPRPEPGAPEGELPNLNEVRQRAPRSPRAPREVPSIIRSRKNPLVPWDGRRVGDPLPITGSAGVSPAPSSIALTGTTRVSPASLVNNDDAQAAKRGSNSARHRGKASGKRVHHASRARISAPPLADDQFIQNFFYWALLRYPNGTETTYWNDIYRKAYANGQGSLVVVTRELGKTLFESSEYAARARDNHWYVYDLYKTYLMRDPDPAGWAFWESAVPASGRENVRRAFEDSGELANLLATITPNGSISSGVTSLVTARTDGTNQPGNGMLSRDANWSITLLGLPGRSGLDLGLALSYSSAVWTRSGPYIYFDEDNGFPSPGFRLGFPTVQRRFFNALVGKNAYLLTSSGGHRVELRQVGSSTTYEAADSCLTSPLI